jgi:transcriptional regulator with XRE-family HTH domain
VAGNIAPDEIRLLREVLGITQQQLALMLGVHPMTVSRWERGSAAPTAYNVQQLRFLARGSAGMAPEHRDRFVTLIAMGFFVVALAFVIALAVDDVTT